MSHLLKAVCCALEGCSYLLPPLPVAGKTLHLSHTLSSSLGQCRASGLLLTREVLNMSIITVLRGRWKRAFWRMVRLFVVSERGWLLATEVGRGCCVGERCGQQNAAPRGAGGQEERSRGSGGSFHSQGQIILSKAGRGCPLGENRKSCEISMHVSAEAVPVHTCPHLPFEPAQLPDIYLCLCCRAGLVGFTITKAFQ